MRVALVAIGLTILSLTPVLADAPPVAAQAAQAAQSGDPVLRSPAPASIANRGGPERRRCREQAARLHLFGLAQHKFLLRCRAGRRQGTETSPPR